MRGGVRFVGEKLYQLVVFRQEKTLPKGSLLIEKICLFEQGRAHSDHRPQKKPLHVRGWGEHMPSERLVRSIIVSHGLKFKPLKDFDNDYEKFKQWHIEQFQDRLRKDMRFLIAVDIAGMIALITALCIFIMG